MAFESWLIHTCTIQRATRTPDAYNNAVESWSDVATAVPCRYTEKRRTVVISERTEQAVVSVPLLLVNAGVDLRERDRISQLTLEDGTVLERVFVITTLLTRRGMAARHESALLSEVN